jgi:hypothetical protein
MDDDAHRLRRPRLARGRRQCDPDHDALPSRSGGMSPHCGKHQNQSVRAAVRPRPRPRAVGLRALYMLSLTTLPALVAARSLPRSSSKKIARWPDDRARTGRADRGHDPNGPCDPDRGVAGIARSMKMSFASPHLRALPARVVVPSSGPDRDPDPRIWVRPSRTAGSGHLRTSRNVYWLSARCAAKQKRNRSALIFYLMQTRRASPGRSCLRLAGRAGTSFACA